MSPVYIPEDGLFNSVFSFEVYGVFRALTITTSYTYLDKLHSFENFWEPRLAVKSKLIKSDTI